MSRLEKVGILAGIVAAIVAAIGGILTMIPVKQPPLGPNVIRIADASYVSIYTPRKRSSIWEHLRDACENKATCNFHCDNGHSAGDPDKGTGKHCIINYACSNDLNNKISKDVIESSGVYQISCQQPK